jgi:hypothetical protein
MSMMTFPWRIAVSICLITGSATLGGRSVAHADQIPAGWEASNMHPIGYSDLDGRGGAFKMAIKQTNGHWYLYLGHLWNNGWSIVDVTDPAKPTVAKFIPGPKNTRTAQIVLDGDIMLTGLEMPNSGSNMDPNAPFEEGVLVWDISDPLNPKLLSHWKSGGAGTHRNGYPGGRYAYLSANMPGYKGNILVVLDISDPKNPKEAGRWWLPGQENGEGPPVERNSDEAHHWMFHGPPMLDGNVAYLGYGPAVLVLDVNDASHFKVLGRLDLSPPFNVPGIALHDVLPIPGKHLLFANSEAAGGDAPNTFTCTAGLPLVAMIDIKDPTKPRLMSVFPTPVPPRSAPYTDFCDKGGRFGPHNTNLEQHSPDVEKQANLIYLTYFNAGLRIFDIEDPRLPKEVGWFIPPTPTQRLGPVPWKLVNQTEVVLVDTRGNIYIDDKQWGLFVLRYDGKGEPAPTAK